MNDPRLTEEELGILHQMLAARKWDSVLHDLSTLLPAMLIAGYGIWIGDPVITVIAILLYSLWRLKIAYYQDRLMRPLQSGIRKLMNSQKCEQSG